MLTIRVALISALFALGSGVACRYGDRVDATRFQSVTQNESGAVLYTVQELVYRPAAGFAAYPDGGIPSYLRDRNLVGLLDRNAARPRVLRVFDNRDWQHGQGQLTIHSFRGRTAIIIEAGQRRTDYVSDARYYMVDTRRGTFTALPLKKELAAKGREVGYFYLLDEAGRLLFVTPPVGLSGRSETRDNQIWLRKPAGDYVLIASGADVYERSSQRLVYWSVEKRSLHVYDLGTDTTRAIERYVAVPERPPEREVRMSDDRTALEWWIHDAAASAWHRQTTVLTVDSAR